MKKTFSLLTVFICLLVGTSFSQKIIINGENTQRKLVWSDFTGKVDKGSSFSAYTAYKTNYRTENVQVFGDAVSVGKFEVTLEFDAKNSWAKQDRLSDELLVHEQGHFDIGMLFVKELLAKFKNAKLTKANFNSVLQNIMTETSKKYNAMGIDYDNETDHSKNKEQQLKWNMFFEESLKAIYN